MHSECVHSNLHDLLRFDTVIISIVILKTEGLQKVCLSILRIATRQQIVKNYDFFSHKNITYCNSESDFWIIKKKHTIETISLSQILTEALLLQLVLLVTEKNQQQKHIAHRSKVMNTIFGTKWIGISLINFAKFYKNVNLEVLRHICFPSC